MINNFKRLLEQNLFLSNERKIFETLNNIKNHTDELVLQNDKILKNEEYFNQEVNRNVATEFTNLSVEFNSNEENSSDLIERFKNIIEKYSH